ncbi:Septin [Geosmithia morbida]|uniref:Septin n=1 Tax=Geosmithia morbida TaxID=1094350 RepID=A0A9P4YUZ4_9HYPO|nr:Septin [Geosmithia morbida]KAF4123300.1 Septin [Geosmithia morbida]
MSIISSSPSLDSISLAPSSSPPRRGRRCSPMSRPDSSSPHYATPQFIMPSLAVPQRRPFSEAGKSVGKLKIFVAGRLGIGKTSLIHAMAHCCEHIVHLDPVASTVNDAFREMWASTKPRPWWRDELEPTLAGSRRRSSVGEILERNICFVVQSSSQSSTAKRYVESDYVDAQLSPLLSKPIDDSDLRTILSEGGAPIVDVVLYMIPHTGLEHDDIDCIKSLQDKTNVVALLARSDELDSGTIYASKQKIREQIDEHSLDCFTFVAPDLTPDIPDIFSVSSVTMTDHGIMDASVLMNSGYVQPLLTTDLGQLVNHVFSADGCARLRDSAAAKCIQWRRTQDRGFYLDMALMRRDPADYALSPILTTNPFMQHRYWGRIELSNWAQGLRNSLHTEQMDRVDCWAYAAG